MKMKEFFKSKKTWLNIWVVVLVFTVVAVVAWGCEHGSNPLHMGVSDNIEQIDLDTAEITAFEEDEHGVS